MNKNCYRIIFNTARAAFMAVAETARSETKHTGTAPRRTSGTASPIWATLRSLVLCLLSASSFVWSMPNAYAQIIADPGAPAIQRPNIVNAANGVPLVNIRTPSAAGVSRNVYKQFDVQRQGAILNNARTNVQTKLGGWVQGNPYLTSSTARVILNEINSNNPSLLHGYVEVAGSRAQVVIANPAGISCDGCGFINAERSTLTTGTPIVNNGGLDGFRVEGGSITVSGAGLDDSRSDYTDLIARSVQINAGIWAKQLKVTTGANQVDGTNTGAVPIAGAGASPAFGIDVATLGGMYAGKITLVGTESGVGVRNAGNIGATAGDVLIIADGRLENSGQIASVGSTQIAVADDIRNSGVINVQAGADLRTPGAIDNTGGLIRSGDTVAIDVDRLINANTQGTDRGIEGQSVRIAAPAIDNRLGAMRANIALTITSRGTLDNTQGLISSAQSLAIEDADLSDKTLAIVNTDGTLIANQTLNMGSFSLTGDGDVLSTGDLSVKVIDDYTHTGQLQANGNASLETAGILINHSALLVGAALDLKATTIDNQAGGEIVAGQVNAAVPNTLINRGLIDGNDTFIESATLNNLGTGRIYGDHVAIDAVTIDNQTEGGTAAVIAARDRLDIGGQTLNNGEGALLFSAGGMAIGGGLDAAKHATGQSTAINNLSGTIEALGDLTIDAAALTNKRSAFSTKRVASTELPAGLELLAYDPALKFSWDIVETDPVNWRNYVRDLYINHIDSISGIEMDASYRNQLVALIDTQPRSVYQDSVNVWNLLINKINNDRPGWINAMAEHLSSQSFPLRSYDQRCRDEECDYITYETRRRIDYKDVITSNAPSATIRTGGNGAFTIGSLTNQHSAIETGGDITLIGSTLFNQGAEIYLQSDYLSTGYTSHWLRNPKDPFSNASSTSRLLETAPAVISAGGVLTGSFTDRIDNIAVRENSAPSAATGTTIATLNVHNIAPGAAGPGNSLFSLNTANANAPLIETDPRFANYRTWLSSDYMLQQLNLDPALTQQRLGDGFYEQQLIREQVARLTGNRFLDGYANDEAQYRALLDQGLFYAQQWNLVPGIALSAAQMAQLTSDMVWLVKKTLTLSDGTQKITFVPQLYARVREGDVLASGALITADDLQLNIDGTLTNSGTIAGRGVIGISADTIDVLGGSIRAGDLLDVSAAQDLNVVSSTNEIAMAQADTQNRVTLNQLNSIAGLYVTNANGILVASAGRDLNLDGASISNSGANGQTALSAGRDLNLGTVADTKDTYARIGRNWTKTDSSTEVGSTVQTTGDVTLFAGRDLTTRAAYVNSEQGALTAIADRDIHIATGTAESHLEGYNKSSRKGFLSSKSTTEHRTSGSETHTGSTFSGDAVYVDAGHDLNISGSNVVSTHGTQLSAGSDITIEATTDTYASTYLRKQKRSGVFSSGGASLTVGSQKQSNDNRGVSTAALSSTVGSTEGDVTIRTSEAYKQVGSDALAPQGNIDIIAEKVDIVETRETGHYTQEHKFKQSGISVSVTSPVISAVQTARQMADAAQQTDDPRMQALAAATTGLAAKDAYDAVTANPGAAGGINISISLGSSKSHSKSEQTHDAAVGSAIVAGGDVRITATGAGEDSDLTVRGANITAGNDINLKADDEINLLAAQNNYTQHSNNKSSSASVGVGIALGGNRTGISFQLGASAARGQADGEDVSWSHTHIGAGETAQLFSDGDTTLKGAVVEGNQVIAEVGGDFNIESLQDTSTYDSREKSGGFSLSLCIPPLCAGTPVSGSVSAGRGEIDSDYRSVTERSGIEAGDGGFQVHVQGGTTLIGAAIASTNRAVEDGKNVFTTGGELQLADLHNHAEYEAEAMSANLGTGVSFGGKLVPQGTSAGYGEDSGSAESVTTAGISGIAGNTSVRTGDAPTGIAPIFDADKVAKEIQAQVQITQAFGQHAHQAVSSYVQDARKTLREQMQQATTEEGKAAIQAQLDDLLLQERVMNVLIGAVTGMGDSAVTKESLSIAADEMREISIENSKLFDGITDGSIILRNLNGGKSEGLRGDGISLGGTRADLDLLCGKMNERCKTQVDIYGNKILDENGIPKLEFTADNLVQFDPEKAGVKNLAEFLEKSDEGKKMAGDTGGIQGWKGTFFGRPYSAGSWQDKLVTAFEGTHDFLGGQVTGLYDEQGNIKRGMNGAERRAYDVWSGVAILPSTPFAMAELLPPEIWKAISIFLEAAK